MKKVLYGLWAISALAATSVYAAPVQVGEAAGSAAASVSATISINQPLALFSAT